MKQKLPNFKIATRKSVLDIPYESDKQYTSECEKLVAEQNKILKKKGYKLNKYHDLHFYDSPYTTDFTTDMCISDAVQCLAIKDGYDLVKFDNGNYGYVAYYNRHKNGFEILRESEER